MWGWRTEMCAAPHLDLSLLGKMHFAEWFNFLRLKEQHTSLTQIPHGAVSGVNACSGI